VAARKKQRTALEHRKRPVHTHTHTHTYIYIDIDTPTYVSTYKSTYTFRFEVYTQTPQRLWLTAWVWFSLTTEFVNGQALASL